ncbi:hypothetical protein TorRG33x02_091070 [Trema orientale]|uniref:Uncharacterized protein n=1 Tax=Trema orientale TaxID=63057 RepID=A0A2P5FBS2_TREOI|nr:hypothetical protein TorRG33x02_091070 [Trema orientale]
MAKTCSLGSSGGMRSGALKQRMNSSPSKSSLLSKSKSLVGSSKNPIKETDDSKSQGTLDLDQEALDQRQDFLEQGQENHDLVLTFSHDYVHHKSRLTGDYSLFVIKYVEYPLSDEPVVNVNA